MQGDCFIKTKIDHTAAAKLTIGKFSSKSSLVCPSHKNSSSTYHHNQDFASISHTMPRTVSVHRECFVSSEITPEIENSILTFYIPRPFTFSEADILDIAGRVISLVLLPPDAVYHMSTDCTEAVKVLAEFSGSGPLSKYSADGVSWALWERQLSVEPQPSAKAKDMP